MKSYKQIFLELNHFFFYMKYVFNLKILFIEIWFWDQTQDKLVQPDLILAVFKLSE